MSKEADAKEKRRHKVIKWIIKRAREINTEWTKALVH